MNLWSRLIVIPSRKHSLFNCLLASAQQEKRCRHVHRSCNGGDILRRALSAPVLARSETSPPLRGDATCPPMVLKAFCDSNTIDRGGAGISERILSSSITGRSPLCRFTSLLTMPSTAFLHSTVQRAHRRYTGSPDSRDCPDGTDSQD